MNRAPSWLRSPTFNTRIRDHSDLPPQALLVALTISELRYKQRLKPHEPLRGASLDGLAAACHMHRATCSRWLGQLVASGWIVRRPVTVGGRRTDTEYWVAEGGRDVSPVEHQNRADVSPVEHADVSFRTLTMSHPRDDVLRSKYKGGDADAPHSGGGGPDEEDTPHLPHTDPAPAPAPAKAGTGAGNLSHYLDELGIRRRRRTGTRP